MFELLEKEQIVDSFGIDQKIYCPIFNDEIDAGFCYEINSVAFGLCTPHLINNITDRETAIFNCTNCVNCQF